ncbi:uncharacterized protein C6orf226 homolog [Oreochromis aureus]|uniref:uncharacterized protein C6orf226 homolog n=1 Tax=Oreochromis aureus TaxID=47969 RepID=UPI0012BBF923|nr:uncharacterized protein C6orf226 homolog [Oreochromis aureus]
MELVFTRFDSFDFEADQRFVDGLKSVNRTETDLLDLKLFFYNRFVEPIDRTGYKQWSSSSCVRGCPDEELDRTASSHSDSELKAETSEPTETKQLSFAEVMRLVQEGKEVPGVTKVDIQPSNQNPTPSRMERMLKPWETTSSSPE